ncbi:hypothetical protein A8D95_27630 [Burkholderia cenocepacia]|uniref:Uncharacterized protein n=1 Tax=Burkholderia cenocepacia TaxID=95486 RepID=A0A1V2VWR6_9BURK|nr:hypothetical protein A8E75_16855 [Burkholderia cenocepacia]ONJ04727.1 hypothetical protein A8D83_20800 [Burkholderia cenocepacia]ONP15730.1 hypothetical protein A8D84_38770 [Burkholderia cenocepacia]ONP27502.1 hypothetical protein A8D85_37395 [Burkholderia cenocepacia]ONP47761.1 hypothetical protein A8D86_08765 [Burkholderia cenocepacia]
MVDADGDPPPPVHDARRVVMENCMNIQYSTRRTRAAQVQPLRPVRRACGHPPQRSRHRELWLTHSDGQANCHPAI